MGPRWRAAAHTGGGQQLMPRPLAIRERRWRARLPARSAPAHRHRAHASSRNEQGSFLLELIKRYRTENVVVLLASRRTGSLTLACDRLGVNLRPLSSGVIEGPRNRAQGAVGVVPMGTAAGPGPGAVPCVRRERRRRRRGAAGRSCAGGACSGRSPLVEGPNGEARDGLRPCLLQCPCIRF